QPAHRATAPAPTRRASDLTTAPNITTPASGSTVECDGSGNTSAYAAWLSAHGGAAASDACGSGVTWSDNSGTASWVSDCGNSKHIAITFTAKDACNNAATTAATFTIKDTTAPTITTPASGSTVECAGASST